MTWLDIVAPLMVIGLMSMIFYFIASSEGISRQRRKSRSFPPTQRDLAAAGRLWRRRWRHALHDQTTPPSPSSS
jgi:hypothetical protein